MASWQHIEFARAWLNHVCIPDPHYPLGVISSIYFDTPQLASYQEKVNGEFSKTKVRLRWYDPAEKEKEGKIPAFLEIKMKDGNKTHKERKKLLLSKEWLHQVVLTDEVLAQVAAENLYGLGVRNPDQLFPVLEVIYHRERFICTDTGARVNLDTQISVERSNHDLLPNAGPVNVGDVVVEIKDEVIKDVFWLEDIYKAGFRLRSYSKYGLCVDRLLHGVSL